MGFQTIQAYQMPSFIKYENITHLLTGYMRRINYYTYASYNNVFSPLLDPFQNKIIQMLEG